MKRFPVPVTGQPIPKGWFARLVNFMNGLILSGDGSYVEVNYGDKGATITLTAAAKNKLDRASGSPPGGGSVTVNGMVYPDWSTNPFSGFSLNFPYTTVDGDAWIFFNGNWTSMGAGTSYLHLIFNVPGGGTKSYQVAAFTSNASGEQFFFEKFLPIKKNSTFTLVDTTAGTHTIILSNAWLFNYPST